MVGGLLRVYNFLFHQHVAGLNVVCVNRVVFEIMIFVRYMNFDAFGYLAIGIFRLVSVPRSSISGIFLLLAFGVSLCCVWPLVFDRCVSVISFGL